MNIVDKTVLEYRDHPRKAEMLLSESLGKTVHVGWCYDPDFGEYCEVLDDDFNIIRMVNMKEKEQ